MILYLFFIVLLSYIIFQRYLRKDPSPLVEEIKQRLSYIREDYGRIPIHIDDSAYTINKRTIYICLKDRETGQVYDVNTLMYVTLHELAHILTREKEYDMNGKVNDHGPKFLANFEKLLRVATNRGIYDPNKPLPQSYCGVSQ